MDPSYNNGVGSQVPQSNLQNGFQQPLQSQQPVISSGSEDIVLTGGGEDGKKSRKKVILIVLIIIVILIGGGLLLWQSGVFNGNNNSEQALQANNLEEKYNDYVNYVLLGEDSFEKPDVNMIGELTPYFETFEGDSLEEYFSKTNEKFTAFEKDYSKVMTNGVDLNPLKIYFQDFADVWSVSNLDILSIAINEGLEKAKNLIDDKFSSIDTTGELREYTLAMKNYYNIYLESIAKIINAGCVNNGMMIHSCYNFSEEEQNKLNDAANTANTIEDKLHNLAITTLKTVYIDLYGAPKDDNVEAGGENE